MDNEYIDRSIVDLDLIVAHAELKLHIMAARQCIRDDDYLLYLYNKRQIQLYLNDIKMYRIKVIEAMFNAK